MINIIPNENSDFIGRVKRDERGLFYDFFTQITLHETNLEGTVSHDHFAVMFGKARELFALECIPGFTSQVGIRYLLQTCTADYRFKKNFHFGDIVIVRVRLLRIGTSSFVIGGEFVNGRTSEVHATAEQTIVCTDKNGKPIEIPSDLRPLLMDALSPKS